jgi:hypothetical protein
MNKEMATENTEYTEHTEVNAAMVFPGNHERVC